MKKRIALAVAVLLVLGGAIFYNRFLVPTRNAVAIGTAMLAKQMCTCMYVAERPRDDCRADQFASMDAITVETGPEPGVVRAFVPGLGEHSARFTEEFGCMLQ
jgi:hypothetical protein